VHHRITAGSGSLLSLSAPGSAPNCRKNRNSPVFKSSKTAVLYISPVATNENFPNIEFFRLDSLTQLVYWANHRPIGGSALLSLKTDKARRFFCSYCKAALVVSGDSAAEFVAVCPNYTGSERLKHDFLWLRFAETTACDSCHASFKPGVEFLDAKTILRCPFCDTPNPSAAVEPSPLVKEALRIFGGYVPSRSGSPTADPSRLGVLVEPEAVYKNRQPQPDTTRPAPAVKTTKSLHQENVLENLLIQCEHCGTKNRVAKPPRTDGFYTCGQCKKVIPVLEADLNSVSTSSKNSDIVIQNQLELPVDDDRVATEPATGVGSAATVCSNCPEILFGKPKINIEGHVLCYRCAKCKDFILNAARKKEADSKYQSELASYAQLRAEFENRYAAWERQCSEYVGSFFTIRLISALGRYLVWLPYLLGFTLLFLVMAEEASGWYGIGAWIAGFAGGIYLLGKVPQLKCQLTEDFSKKFPNPVFTESYPERRVIPIEITLLAPDGSRLDKTDYRSEILRRDGYRCQACEEAIPMSPYNLEVHHVLPVSKGGIDDPTNLVTLCKYHHDREDWFDHVRAYPTTLARRYEK
jgi:hypothetical protein